MTTTPVECEERFVELLNSGEIDDLLMLWEPDGVHLADDGRLVRGRDAIRPEMERFNAMGMQLTLDGVEVEPLGDDLAVVRDRWTMTPADPLVDKVETSGAGIHLVRRGSDGGWRFAATGLGNAGAAGS